MAQNSNVPRSHENYITHVSEEIEGRVTKKLSQEFSRTENRILGTLSLLDDFLMNPLIQGHSGTAPETSRNAYGTNQGTNEDESQSDPHPEASIFRSQTTQNSGPEDGHDTSCPMVGGAQSRKTIFVTSCVTADGMDLIMQFLHLLVKSVESGTNCNPGHV